MLDAAHGQRVVADDAGTTAEHPCGGGPRRGSDLCGVAQPAVELADAAVETLVIVSCWDEQLNRAQLGLTQAVGI